MVAGENFPNGVNVPSPAGEEHIPESAYVIILRRRMVVRAPPNAGAIFFRAGATLGGRKIAVRPSKTGDVMIFSA